MRVSGGRTGQLLGGKYRLEELLGLGGMGLVYGARHLGTGRSVAVKLLRAELAVQPEVVRRVAREARLAVEAAHPNVVQILDSGSDENGVPYLVLERLYGKPLQALMGTILSRRAAVEALMPVMNALVTLHRAGIVHRDIKPSNLFLECGTDGRITPKLLDFGLAKTLESDGNTHSGVALGTPAYMAPEQALGLGRIGPTTDVWAMAVVLVHCLTGALPFAGHATNGLASLRFGLRPHDLSLIPEPIARVLARALELEASARPADMLAFRSELADALAAAEPAEKWPNESTVSYARGESELELALAAATSEVQHVDADADAVHARAPDLVTRTLTRLQGMRAPRKLPAALLAAAALTAAALVVLPSAPRRSPELTAKAPNAARNPAKTAAAESPTLSAVELTTLLAPAPSGSSSVSRPSAPRPDRTRPPEPATPAPKRDAPHLLGANRAPILE